MNDHAKEQEGKESGHTALIKVMKRNLNFLEREFVFRKMLAVKHVLLLLFHQEQEIF